MQYNQIADTIQKLTGKKVKQREIAEILGLRVNAVGLRAARGSSFSAEELEKIGSYFGVDLFSWFKKNQNIDEAVLQTAQNIQKDEILKKLFSLVQLLSAYDRRTLVMLAERLASEPPFQR